MPANTPLGISYPLYTDPISGTQTYFQDMATDMDGLVQQLDTRLTAAAQRPGVRIVSFTAQAIAANTPTTATFAGEDFDQGNMADIAVNNTRIQLIDKGIYIVGASLVMAPAAGTWGVQASLVGTAGFGGGLVSMRGSSTTLDASTTPNYLNPVSLWYADGVSIVNITCVITHNAGAAVNLQDRALFAAKVSNTPGSY
jgi:hypothetical protein